MISIASRRAVELGIRLLSSQRFRERSREPSDHTVLLAEALVSLVTRVAAREGDNLQHAQVLHELRGDFVRSRLHDQRDASDEPRPILRRRNPQHLPESPPKLLLIRKPTLARN